MKQIILGLLIVLITVPVAYAECDFQLEIGDEGTCGNYKIRHDSWGAGAHGPYQIAHFHLWRLSPPADLGSDSIDMFYEFEKYYDGNKLYVNYWGYCGDPRKAKYRLEDLTPQLTVKGFFSYKDRNLNWASGKWAEVWLWDYDFSGGHDWLGSAVTDENGYFEFSPIENVDWDEDEGKLDIIVGFATTNSSIGNVTDASSITHYYYEDTYYNMPDELSLWCETPDDPTKYKAWWVYYSLYDGWDYLADTVSYSMDYTEVHWQWGHDADFGCGSNTTHAHGNGFGSTIPCIHLDGRKKHGDGGGHANDPDIIIHEYGHCVMYKIFGDYWPPVDCSQGHQMDEVSEPGCAWTEGWANFMPLAVFNDEYFTDITYGHGSYNLETRDGGIFPDGDSCEGNVAAALWDLLDPNNEGYDDLTVEFDEIWDVLQDQTTDEDTFSDFYVSWHDLGHDEPKANAAIFQSTIDYNNPPSCVIISPNGGGCYSDTITVSAYSSDNTGGYVDGTVSQVEFEYYGQTWHDIGTDTSPAGGWSVQWNTGSLTDPSVWVRARAMDNLGEECDWDESDGFFGVDNTEPSEPPTSSSTHPDENTWYSNNDPSFEWDTPDDPSGIDGYSYLLDASGSTTPDETIDTAGNSKSYIDVADDIWYFHVRAKDNAGNWGGADHYTVKINSTEISARIRITHHYGNASDYNGVPMFNLMEAVPEGASPLDLLQSVADVTMYEGRVYSINGIAESPPVYWYLYINGIPAPDEDIDSYLLRDGEVVHWDYSSMINAGEGGGGAAMNHPEPSTSDIVKLIPQGTTLLDALQSVVDITMRNGRVYSIHGIPESPPYYWHIYINDVQVPDEDVNSYQLQGGEVIHWECSNVNIAGE